MDTDSSLIALAVGLNALLIVIKLVRARAGSTQANAHEIDFLASHMHGLHGKSVAENEAAKADAIATFLSLDDDDFRKNLFLQNSL